jgi:MoaA/NifB/PqqE/SkfB family radical SAM enzyme
VDYKISEDTRYKLLRSPTYNYCFDKTNGLFLCWGKNVKDDPAYSPYGPVLLDVELSTICSGINGTPCTWCYKSNTPKGHNMSLETFKKIFHKIPRTLTQVAFGIGNLSANPELWDILTYCRNNPYNYVIPNITINGAHLTDEYAERLVKLCGAVSVSCYEPKNVCYDAIKKLTDLGLKQCNIHKISALETYDSCLEVMRDSKEDEHLKKLNAIVFLALKPKGDRNTFHKLGKDKFKTLIDYALVKDIKIGFDSCSAPMFLESVKDRPNYKRFERLSEPCESFSSSLYINVFGKAVACSFLADHKDYQEIDVINCEDFLNDVWFSEPAKQFRDKLLKTETSTIINSKGCRSCPEFDIY